VTYEEFVNSRLPALLRYALMLSGDPETAADITQETMIRVQLKWRHVNRAEMPERYVRKMLTNVYLDWRRTPWLRRVSLRGVPHEPPPVPDPAEHAADRDQVWALLAGLPRRQRAAVVLRYYEGLADQEIADVLGCAIGTVRAHISRALATLRVVLTPAHAGGGNR
jgi:RNA polymerase sigma-70 factor (sigma-E family)